MDAGKVLTKLMPLVLRLPMEPGLYPVACFSDRDCWLPIIVKMNDCCQVITSCHSPTTETSA